MSSGLGQDCMVETDAVGLMSCCRLPSSVWLLRLLQAGCSNVTNLTFPLQPPHQPQHSVGPSTEAHCRNASTYNNWTGPGISGRLRSSSANEKRTSKRVYFGGETVTWRQWQWRRRLCVVIPTATSFLYLISYCCLLLWLEHLAADCLRPREQERRTGFLAVRKKGSV